MYPPFAVLATSDLAIDCFIGFVLISSWETLSSSLEFIKRVDKFSGRRLVRKTAARFRARHESPRRLLPVAAKIMRLGGLLNGLLFPIFVLPVLCLLADRTFGTEFFTLPAGSPFVYEYLFWMFGHPEVYFLIIPVFGLCRATGRQGVGRVRTPRSRRDLRHYRFARVVTMLLLGSFTVWGHHLLTSHLSRRVLWVFLLCSLGIAFVMGRIGLEWLRPLRFLLRVVDAAHARRSRPMYRALPLRRAL